MAEDFTKAVKSWVIAVIQGTLSTVAIALLPGAVVIYLEHLKSAWASPVLYGLGASMMAAVLIAAIRLVRSLPDERVIPNVNNVEGLARNWLDNFGYSVKREPLAAAYFRFVVTTDNKTPITVIRPRDNHAEYIVFRTDIIPTDAEKTIIGEFSEDNRQLFILELQLEMARAKVGYSSLGLPLGPFNIFNRLPINSSLTEHEFVGNLDAIECAKTSVATIFRMMILRAKQNHTEPAEPKQLM